MLTTELNVIGDKVFNRRKKTRMAELLEFNYTSLIINKHWPTAGLTNCPGSLCQTDETIKLRDDSHSSQPCAVVLIEASMESTSDFLDNLTVGFLCLLQLANEGAQLREVVALHLLGSRHLIPVLRDVLHLDWNLKLVDLFAVVSEANGRRTQVTSTFLEQSIKVFVQLFDMFLGVVEVFFDPGLRDENTILLCLLSVKGSLPISEEGRQVRHRVRELSNDAFT